MDERVRGGVGPGIAGFGIQRPEPLRPPRAEGRRGAYGGDRGSDAPDGHRPGGVHNIRNPDPDMRIHGEHAMPVQRDVRVDAFKCAPSI